MTPFELFRRVTGIGGERTFIDVSGRPGTTSLESEGGFPTVVAIHGFAGVPGEVELCVQVAQSLGLGTCAPLLAGHGSTAQALSTMAYPDWLESARRDFDRVRRKGPVILVGLSLGSLIATELCLSAPGDVAGLVLLSNAFWLKQPHPALSLWLAGLLGVPNCYIDKRGPDLGDLSMLASHVTLDAQPLHSAISLVKNGKRLRGELFRVHRPTLIVHGACDRVCSVTNAWRVARLLGTSDVRTVILPRSHHIITRDSDRTLLNKELREFFGRVAQGAKPWAATRTGSPNLA